MIKQAWNVGITTKLVWILVFFSLIPLSVQVYSLFQTAEVLKEEVGVQYQAVAEGIAEKIRLQLIERYADAQILSRNRLSGSRGLGHQAGDYAGDFVDRLNVTVQASEMYSLIQVVDLEGHLIAVNDRDAEGRLLQTEWLYEKNYQSAPWFLALQQYDSSRTGREPSSKINIAQEVFIEGVTVDRDVKQLYPQESGLTVGLSVPLYDQGQVVGYGNLRMKFSKIEEFLREAYQTLKKAGFPHAELIIQDSQGMMLAEYAPSIHQTEDMVRDLDNVLLKKNLVQLELEAAQLAVQGKSGYARNYHPGKQANQVIGY